MVFAVAGALVYPALQPALLAVQGEAAARRTAAFLDDVRRRAVIGRTTLTVACLPEENKLVVRAEGGGEEPLVTFAVPEHADLVSCRPEEARYLPQGYASGFTLLLRDGRAQEYEVSVGAFTGLARLERAP